MIRKLTIVAASLLVLVGAFALKDRAPSGSPSGTEVASADVPLPRLVDLGADKCVPCKQMAPILEELAVDYRGRLTVEFIDVWKDPEAGKPYAVRVIPTQIFFDAAGKERFRHEGFMAREAILAKWKELGVDLRRSGEAES